MKTKRMNERQYSLNGTTRTLYLHVLVARPCLCFGMCRGIITTLVTVDCKAFTFQYIGRVGSFDI